MGWKPWAKKRINNLLIQTFKLWLQNVNDLVALCLQWLHIGAFTLHSEISS